MAVKKPCCTLEKLETAEAGNGIRTRRHVLGQEPDQQWGAAPQNGSDIVGLVVLAWGVALCTPELGPDTCSRPAVTELPPPQLCSASSCILGCILCIQRKVPCSWPSRQASTDWLRFKRHFLAAVVCLLCSTFLVALLICAATLTRG